MEIKSERYKELIRKEAKFNVMLHILKDWKEGNYNAMISGRDAAMILDLFKFLMEADYE